MLRTVPQPANPPSALHRFLREESGAVTVDWVVLTAGLVGVGIATLALTSGGVENLSSDIGAALAAISPGEGFAGRFSGGLAGTVELLSTGFSDGLGSFVGGRIVNVSGFGPVLQLGPGEMTQALLEVPDGASSATIRFDMIGVDNLSGPEAVVMINGQAVALYADNHGTITTTDLSGSGISVTVDQIYSNDPMGGSSAGHDSRATYTITVEDPGQTISFGVGSTTGQPISEEFYAIDDVEISAS